MVLIVASINSRLFLGMNTHFFLEIFLAHAFNLLQRRTVLKPPE